MKVLTTLEYKLIEHTITDNQAIRKAISAPEFMPDSFIDRKLTPIGMSKFKGDKFIDALSSLSVNDQFTIGETYPVYDNEGIFVIGKDGIGKKMTPIAWTAIKYF